MKNSKITVVLFIITIALCLGSCGNTGEKKAENEVQKIVESVTEGTVEVDEDSATIKVDTPDGSITADLGKSGEGLELPERFPEDVVPLADDANIINVRDNNSNGAIGVAYVSGKDIDTLLELYETAFSDAENLSTMETDNGYMISCKKNNINIMILIDEGIFDHIPEYKGKQSVNIELGMQN